ncbi:MAG: sigma-70 family RNA polymerase sigma factor [Acidimicrobiia bacterium]|nr:sigma-70 family RNA polymerase sigma factor [Acidimicrobiia bacterium]
MPALTPQPDDREDQAGARLAELYAAHAAPARRFAYLLCGNAQQADDIVQEAFVRVGARIGGLRNPDAFPWYLRRTIRNLLRMQARRESRERTYAVRLQAVSVRSASGTGPTEHHEELWRALRALPERQRAALVCRLYLDLSERETARILRCRPGTVKSLVSRGLAALRKDRTLDDR